MTSIQMTRSKLLTTSTLASLFLMGISINGTAAAEVSASIAVSNMYLFRGANLTSDGAPAVSGSLDWTHDSGVYGTVWTSSEGASGSYEVDLIAGFRNSVGDFSYDVSLVSYEYPGTAGSESYGDVSEFILSLGFQGLSFSYVEPLHGGTAGDYNYFTLGYEMDRVGFMVGTYTSDSIDEYTHLDISFAATDEISFILSTIIDDGTPGEILDTDPLLSVTWSKSFDL